MGVEEIFNFLKKKRRFYSASRISRELNLNVKSVRKSLNILLRYKDITAKYIQLERKKKKERTGIKTRKAWVYAYKGGKNNGRKRR